MTNTEQTRSETNAGAPARTTIARPWLVRMLIITVVLWAFGAWGFYDATVVYPRRGRLFAERQQLAYLQAARSAGKLFDAPVSDPRGELADLRGRGVLELSEFDRAKREWLEALAVPGLGMLKPEHTRFDAQTELQRLEEYFAKNTAPAALSAYDILLQWAICGVCWAIGAYMIGLFLVVKSRVYSWDPATKTLTLPGGTALTPEDLDREEPADLSKWHKFLIFLRPRKGHEKLAEEIKLDLFRYQPLEDWVRVLVKGADPDFEFPDEKKAREEAEQAAEAERAEAVETPAAEEPGAGAPEDR